MSSWLFSRLIASRYLWAKQREAFITIISFSAVMGVAIGVMVLTMTMAIMTGFEHALREKVVGSTHILVFRTGGEIRAAAEVQQIIEETKGVKHASAFVQQQALIRVGKEARGILVKGVDTKSHSANELKKYTPDPTIVDRLSTGFPFQEFQADRSLKTVELPPLLVGQQLMQSLGVIPGMAVSLFSPQVSSTPFGLVPRYKRFVIAGSYSSGLSGYEETLAYTGVDHIQKFFRLGDSVNGFEVMLDDIGQAQKIAGVLFDNLNSRPEKGYYVQDWTEVNRDLWEAIKLEKQVYFIVLLLLIVLASFSIVSTLVMIVLEKRRDIAVLMTLGATKTQIARIFRLQGISIGFLGTVLGLLLGYLGCIGLDYYGFPLPEKVFPTSTVPVKINAFNFIVVGISAFLIACLSTWYPVKRACSVEASEMLRID